MKALSKKFSLQIQLSIMASLMILIIILPVVVLIHFKVNTDLAEKSSQLLQLKSQLFAQKLLPVIQSADDKLATQLLDEFGQDNSLNKGAIFLKDSSSLAYYNLQPRTPVPELTLARSFTKKNSEISIVEPIFQQPVSDKQPKLIGYLYLEFDFSNIESAQLNNLLYLLSILAFGVLTIVIAAKYFKKSLTYPIRRMVRHIQTIYRTQNFEKRLRSKRDDEVGRLIMEFNQMLDTVQERENELTLHGKQLQRLVEVRTEQLYQKAHFDSLTGLPNRYLLVDRLHQAISKSARTNEVLALLFLDLDRFKVINDNLGHQNGDLLLKEVAKRLSKIAREGDTVARLGGDEFVFLLENLNNPQDASKTARRIIDSFKIPFHLQDHILHVSTSIGISIYPADGKDDKILLKNADISMYHAKEKGPGQFSFYTHDMNKSSLERLAIETNLRSAIDNNEFYLLYQPQMRTKDNQYKNVEALLRWKNPQIGDISPGVFIPIAEETAIINQIDLWVITQACKQIKTWKEQGLKDITVAVNISAGQLISDTLLEHLKRQLMIYQINPAQLEIEITEAVFVEHSARTIKTLESIKKLGARIAIDDFGTGYSSLQYIQNFPADTLKLDGMFIRNLMESKASQGIVRSTIILAHSLGLELVAEGVETQEQLDYLTHHQCDLIQGFLLSKPIKPEEIIVFTQ